MEHSIGDTAADKLRTAPVLNYKGVNTALSGGLYVPAEILSLVVGDDRINSQIKLCTVSVTKACCLSYFLNGEICGTASCRKALSAYVYSLSAGAESRTESFHAACGSQYLGLFH